MSKISTTKLRELAFDAYVILDGEVFVLQGVDMQEDGGALVRLRYTDTSHKFDVVVDAQDMDELYWEA